MRVMLLAFFLALASSRCVTSNRLAADERAAAKQAAFAEQERCEKDPTCDVEGKKLEQAALAEQERCEKDPTCDVNGKRQRALEEFQSNYPVTAELRQKDYQERFIKSVCEKSQKNFDSIPVRARAVCMAEYNKTFLAKLAETYPSANWQDVSLWCQANPIDCKEWEKVEVAVRDSHSAVTSAAARATNAKYAEEQDQNRLEKRRKIFKAIGAGLQGMGSAMQRNNSVSCTSNRVGQTTYTNCN